MSWWRSWLLALVLLGCRGDATSTTPPGDLSGAAALAHRLRVEAGPMVSAHRGGPDAGFPENALSTLQHTFESGVQILEVDVRRAGDGILVLMHDDELDRTSTGRGPLSGSTSSMLRAIRLIDKDGRRTDQPVPTLDNALRWACDAGAILTLDVKEGVPYDAVVNAVRARQAEACAAIITYDLVGLLRVHGLAPDMVISVSASTRAQLDEVIDSGVDQDRLLIFLGVVDGPGSLDTDLLSRLRDQDIRTIVGTFPIDEEAYDESPYRELFELGVGVIATDRPDLAQRAVRSSL